MVLRFDMDVDEKIPVLVGRVSDALEQDMRIEGQRAVFPRESSAVDADWRAVRAASVVGCVDKMKIEGIGIVYIPSIGGV